MLLVAYTNIPHSQGKPVERYVQVAIKFVKILMNGQHKERYDKLKEAEHYLNILSNTTTEESPWYLMKEEEPPRHWNVQRRRSFKKIEKSWNRYLHRMELRKRKNKQTFQKGDLVSTKGVL